MKALYTLHLGLLCSYIFSSTCLAHIHESKKNYSIEYIKKKYETSVYGIDCLFYPAKTPKKLYILFTGAVSNIYTMYSWFWKENEDWKNTAYLFLKDDDVRAYLGTEKNPKLSIYQAVIEHFIQYCDIPHKSVYTLGHSMGGFAAIYFTLKLGLGGALTLRPQINWKIASHFFSSKKLGNLWVDLDKMIHQTNHYPIIYIQFGEYPADKDAALTLLEELKHVPSFTIIEKSMNPNHSGYYPTKAFIKTTFNYIEQIRTLIDNNRAIFIKKTGEMFS